MITAETEHLYSTAYGRRVTWHSQPETQQDRWVVQHLQGRENGTFVELGAFDGVYHSNTLALERDFGWDGWLVEAVPHYAAQAQHVRRAKIINVAVGPDEAERDYFVGGQWSGLKDFTRPNLLAGHETFRNPLVTVKTVTLSKLLSSLQVPAVIDYFSLDVEGAEYPILESYFHSPEPLPAAFRCLTIEVGTYADHIHELCALLEPLDYRLDNIREWEAYFIHRYLCP
jgi:FkbM family methyltransferase